MNSLQICSFHHAFPLFIYKKRAKRYSSLFLLFVKDALYKKIDESYLHFEKSESHFSSFALKNRAIRTKTKERIPYPGNMIYFPDSWEYTT